MAVHNQATVAATTELTVEQAERIVLPKDLAKNLA